MVKNIYTIIRDFFFSSSDTFFFFFFGKQQSEVPDIIGHLKNVSSKLVGESRSGRQPARGGTRPGQPAPAPPGEAASSGNASRHHLAALRK